MIFSKRRGYSEELAEGKDFNSVPLKLMNFVVRFRGNSMWSSATAVTGKIPNTNRFSRDSTEFPQPTPRNADSATHP